MAIYQPIDYLGGTSQFDTLKSGFELGQNLFKNQQAARINEFNLEAAQRTRAAEDAAAAEDAQFRAAFAGAESPEELAAVGRAFYKYQGIVKDQIGIQNEADAKKLSNLGNRLDMNMQLYKADPEAGKIALAKTLGSKEGMEYLSSQGIEGDKALDMMLNPQLGPQIVKTIKFATMSEKDQLSQHLDEQELGLDIIKEQNKQRLDELKDQRAQAKSKLEQDKLNLQIDKLEGEISKQGTEAEAKQQEVSGKVADINLTFGSTIDTLDRLLDPANQYGLESLTGVPHPSKYWPGSDAQRVQGYLDTLKGQAFLSEVEKMKGMGALTETEGAKLVQAVGALDNKSMSDEDFRKELQRIRNYMIQRRDVALKKAGAGIGGTGDGAGGNNATGTKPRVNITLTPKGGDDAELTSIMTEAGY